jgi:hypothetical protein
MKLPKPRRRSSEPSMLPLPQRSLEDPSEHRTPPGSSRGGRGVRPDPRGEILAAPPIHPRGRADRQSSFGNNGDE